MKYLKYFLAAFLLAFLTFGTSHALLGEANDSFRSTGNESNLTINFFGETRWVDVMEGGAGGGGMVGFIRINVIDNGLSGQPYVRIYNNTQLWMSFQMIPGEIAHVYVRPYQYGPLLKEVDVTANNPTDFFSKADYTFSQPGCNRTVPIVALVPSTISVPPLYRNVGAIFMKYDLCTQKVLLI